MQYLYEGQQAQGEIRNGTLSQRLLTGLSLDETIARIALNSNGQKDGAQSRIYLTDALNSVIAQLSDDTANPGQLQNSYAYSPYGQSQTVGPDATNNPNQYTSRENDNTGLVYYRARYYDAVLKRFVSSDPIGLAGGMNMYAYVGGNPLSLTDPRGLDNPGMGSYGPYPSSMGFRRGTPGDSCTCMMGSNTFYAPAGTNFSNVHGVGQANGWSPAGVKRNEWQWGTFDFQRDAGMNQFTRAYTDASNFGVGVYMHGAGYSRANTARIGRAAAAMGSSNAGDPNQIKYWMMGWDAANSGNLEYVCQ